MNGSDTYLDVNNSHLRVTSGNVYASSFNLDQISIVTTSNTGSTINFLNDTKGFTSSSNIEVGTANLFVDTTTSRVGIGTDAPAHTLDVHGTANVGTITTTDINVTGNLTVLGTTTTLDTVNLRVKDPIIEIGKDNTASPVVDLGLILTRPATTSNVAIIFDETTDTLEIGYTQSNASDTDITMRAAAEPLSVNVNGTISGNGSGLTALNATNITTGTLTAARIPDLDAAKITSGTLPVTRGGTGTTTSTGTGSVVLSAAPAFTGDVTFDTDTLKIDSTNNRVGIGTTTPNANLHVIGSTTVSGTVKATAFDGVNKVIYATAEKAVSTWTDRTIDASFWRSVTWSPELSLFVAVATSGTNRAATSPDGITWTNRTIVASGWKSVTWSPELSLFVAVASSSTNRAATSPDGVTWTNRTIAPNSWQSVTWSPEKSIFVAVAFYKAATSTDGVTWTSRTINTGSQWRAVTWSPELSLFVAVASSGTNRAATSPDGITWTDRTIDTNNWRSVAWSPELSLFVAVAYSGTNRAATSPDGVTWTGRTIDANYWYSVTWSPELSLFVAVASTGTNRVATSPDGVTWTNRTINTGSDWKSVTWSPELSLFVAMATTGTNRVATSNFGIPTSLNTPMAHPVQLSVDTVNSRVGIGTTSPSSQLELYGAGKDLTFKYDTGISRRSAATRDAYYSGLENSIKRVGDRNIFDGSVFTPDTTHEILMGFSDTYTQWSGNDEYYPSYNEMRFKLWSPSSSTVGSLTDIMTLRGNGNVGIGTTDPGHKLHVTGDASGTTTLGPVAGLGFVDSGVSFCGIKIGEKGASPYSRTALSVEDNGNTILHVDGHNARVGIGTTSPQTNLHIESSGTTGLDIYGGDTNNPYIFIGEHVSNYSRKWGMKMNYYGNSNTEWFNMAVVDDNAEINALTIRRNGNVGIGTTSPSLHTHIKTNNAGSTDDGLLIENTYSSNTQKTVLRLGIGSANYAQIDARTKPAGKTYLTFSTQSGTGSWGDRMTIDEVGNVGIGVTNPDHTLEVRGTIQASLSDANHGMIITHGGTIRRDYGGNGAGFHFTGGAIWPVNYAGNYINNAIEFGNSSYRWKTIWSNTALNTASDDRLKHNEEEVTDALGIINKLKLLKYDKTGEMLAADYNGDLTGISHIKELGFIAQSVLEIPELAFLVSVPGDPEDEIEPGLKRGVEPYGLYYQGINNILVQAVQELLAKNDALEARILALENA